MMNARIKAVGLVIACLFFQLMAFPQSVEAKRPVVVKIGNGHVIGGGKSPYIKSRKLP
jgi:hypothetical protein